MVCGAFVNSLDLECIFVNMFAGSWTIASLIALVFIISLAGRFRMSNAITGSSIALFAILFYSQMPWLIFITIIFTSLAIWAAVASLWKR